MSVSIVLCTAGRPADLAQTLSALGRLPVRADLPAELVVVDNSGGDSASRVVAAADLRGLSARVVSEPRRGLSRNEAAMYVGISAAKFDDLVADGRMPAPVRIDSRKVWDIRALDLAFDALPTENAANRLANDSMMLRKENTRLR